MKSDWAIKISRVENGYVLEWEEEGESDEDKKDYIINHSKVIEDPDDDTELSELTAMKDLLWEISRYFGVNYSKHNKQNINIEIEENKSNEL